jgi:hypothetical protein
METYWVNTYGVIHVEANSEDEALALAHRYVGAIMEPDRPGQPRLVMLCAEGEQAGVWEAATTTTS